MHAIVVGMAPGELVDPIPEEIDRAQVAAIHSRINSNPMTYVFPGSAEAYTTIRQIAMHGDSAVEVFGGWETNCVADAIAMCLINDLTTIVPLDVVAPHPNKNPSKKNVSLDDSVKIWLNIHRGILLVPEVVYEYGTMPGYEIFVPH